jgi:hypothetical protein
MPFSLFGKKEEPEKKGMETLEKKEVEDLNKLSPEKKIVPETPAFKSDVFTLPETPKTEPALEPVKVEKEKELTFDKLPLKDLCKKIDDELRRIKRELKKIEKIGNLTLESPEIVDLLELYTAAKSKFQEFINEINKLELNRLQDKTSAAIYKFKACKSLAEIKEQTQKIEDLCEKTGLVPSKIQDIIRTRAEDLVNSLLLEMRKEEKTQ